MTPALPTLFLSHGSPMHAVRPGAAGAASGAVLAVTFLGAVLGPSGFAMLVAAIGSYATAFALVGLLSATGAVVAWQAHRLERRAIAGVS